MIFLLLSDILVSLNISTLNLGKFMPANFRKFIAFVLGISNRQLPTVGGRSSFSVKVAEQELIYTPKTTGKPRRQEFAMAEKILGLYNDTGSLTPSDYLNITRNASYILALIREFYSVAAEIGEVGSKTELRVEEGRMKEIHYFSKGRNKTLARRRKEHDKYICQVCSFKKKVMGHSVVECHHLFPLNSSGVVATKLEDLITLCPTCHRLAHLRNPPMSVIELKRILGKG